MQRILLIAVAMATGLVALFIIGFYFYERPTVLRVATPKGSESQKLLTALNQQFMRTHADLRFRLVPVADVRAAAKAMDDGAADLAVVRSDVEMPTDAQTALILTHKYAVVAAPPGSTYANIAELKGKKIAIITSDSSAEGNQRLLEAIETEYDLSPNSLIKRPTTAADLAGLLHAGEADAVLAVGGFNSPQLAEVVQILAQSVSPPGEPVFVPILESNAIAKKFPGFETTEILRGAFGGSPSRPASNVETIGVTLRLVARTDLAYSIVGDVTRLILANRAVVVAAAPLANHIEAPSTDKGEVLPTHPGAAAYLDGEEETFFEKYSDVIYIGAMVGSVLLSGMATLASRMTVRGYARFDLMMEQALTIIKAGREAIDLASLDGLELEIDDILTQSLAAGQIPKLDVHQLAAMGLAVQQARLAIADRRAVLLKLKIDN